MVEPKVILLGAPKIYEAGLKELLEELRAPEWTTDAPSDAEKLIEVYGRLCYGSFRPGLNPNVKRIRKGNKKYLGNIVDVGHGSVSEHSMINWVFLYVSRCLTHELCRHRVGTAISQESLRYVRLTKLKAWLPPEIANDEWATTKFGEMFRMCEQAQRELAEHYKIDSMKNFAAKKQLTSAFRRVAPMGLATKIGWSANLRTMRHVIEMRTSRHAEIEIRKVFDEVARICRKEWPNWFADYTSTEYPEGSGIYEWTTPNTKI